MGSELILIVEDNEKNMKLVRDILRFNGYRTIEAVTAEDGLDLARMHRPALILMDIHLPGMDGITALHHLKADPQTQGIAVIAVTASAMPLEREEIMKAGFDGVEIKPIQISELLKHVRTTLDRLLVAKERLD